MQTSDHLILKGFVADADHVRRRLAVVLSEADLLRSLLRVVDRLERERKRLQLQHPSKVRHVA